MSDSPFVPEYAKPDAPGVHMGFDNTVALYYIVTPAVSGSSKAWTNGASVENQKSCWNS